MFRVSILLLSVFTCSVVGVISAGVVGYRANQQEKKVVANSDQAKSENAKATQATSKTKQQEKGDLKSKKDNQKASESKKEDSKNGKSAKGKKQDDSNDHPDKAPNSKSGADAGWLDSDAQKATRKSLEWLSRSHFQSVHSNTKALENCQLCHQAESCA